MGGELKELKRKKKVSTKREKTRLMSMRNCMVQHIIILLYHMIDVLSALIHCLQTGSYNLATA